MIHRLFSSPGGCHSGDDPGGMGRLLKISLLLALVHPSVGSVSVDAETRQARENLHRLRQLRQAREDGHLMQLEEFVTLVLIPPSGAATANERYAQAWGLFNFLFRNRRTELGNYLSSLTQVETEPRPAEVMLREFTDALGSIEGLDRSWLQHLERPH
jgi:hypothetical protein